MGSVLDRYMKSYQHTFRDQILRNPTGEGWVRPDAWMTMKYLQDIGVEPWDPAFEGVMVKLLQEDSEMFEMVTGFIQEFLEFTNNSRKNKE